MTRTNDQNGPTEDQIKASNEAELAKWEGDFKPEDLEVKYSRDEIKQDDKETKEEKPEDSKPVTKDDDGDDDLPEVPEPIITVNDPGEYVPQDYSFEIEIKGKTHKVDTLDKAESLAEEFADDLNAKQLFALVSKGSKIELKQERDKEKWEAEKAKFDEQSQADQARQESVQSLASEIEYLVSKGLMPAIEGPLKDADWSDPEIAKQPGVKEQIALINYMAKENEVRSKAGVKPLTSAVDAFNAWQLDSGRKKEQAEVKASGEARKAAGARVAGVSPSSQAPYIPKGIAVGNPNIFKRSSAIWDN